VSEPDQLRPAVFLDRDGTLIVDVGYPRDPDEVRFLDGALDALRALRAAGFLLVVISNQSGIGRGVITPAEADSVHARFSQGLAEAGITLDGAKYCPHSPDEGCDCRKPKPGMLLEAADELGIDLSASFMVGDKAADVEAGQRAGTEAFQFVPGSWPEVLEAILERKAAG
jgi:D-glycero-D-manno-heptose 1,7-bisphosphate phosphatase